MGLFKGKNKTLKDAFPNFHKFFRKQRKVLKTEVTEDNETQIEFRFPIITFGNVMGYNLVGIESKSNGYELYMDSISRNMYRIDGKRIRITEDCSFDEYNQYINELTQYLLTETKYMHITQGDL